MAINDDGTMDVLVGDRIERRPYTVNWIRGGFNCAGDKYNLYPSAYEPDTGPDETVIHAMGEPPRVIRTRP